MTSRSRYSLTPVAIAVAALCCAMSAQAQTEQDAQDDKMVVWGTQVSNDNSLFSEDIALKQADHLSDLLRDQAGVDIGGSHSMNQGINIRGVSELDLEITIDGVNQANNVFHHAGNLLVNPDILKTVDLQVGNNSVLTGGIGGGIAFETKDGADMLRADEKFGARVMAGVASNDYYNYSTTAYGQLTDTVDVLAYFSTIDRNNPEDGDGVEREGQEGETKNYLVKFGWNANANNRLELAYDYYEDAGDYTQKSNFGYYDHENLIYPIEYTRDSVSLNHELTLDNTNVHTSVYYNEMNYATDKSSTYFGDANFRQRLDEPCTPNGSDCFVGTLSEGNVVNIGIKTLAETELNLADMWHTVRYGAEYNTQESKLLVNGSTSGEEETADSWAVYAEDEVEVATGWFVTPGIRYNSYKLDMAASNDTFTDTTFGLSTKYELTEAWTLRAAATELFKGPALTGSFLTSGSALNPDLKPETGVNYEVGAAFQQEQFIGLDRFGFSTTVFQTNVDDYIDDAMSGKASLYSNLGDYENSGYEIVFNASKGNLSSRLTYSASDSEFTRVEADSGLIKGESLPDEVGDSISFNLGYTVDSIGLNLSWTSLVTMDVEVDDADGTEKDSYDVHNISAAWTPTQLDRLTITAGVENLFDEQYASHASHDMGFTDYEPGRNVKVTVAYQF
ncbi:TonB-dependent receptor domain-containing protein [Ferrimonas lipolytica]|uniref:TonB-dependent receptor n=1 Tax=Ferrimonas lipolytica TaxID=2724191 RepID=A0A6H1UHZ3_9GAMM|nr:TonB-dependent receptor [Ferrimonas lipolytica]QIZ77933.1 TonB-dependent receptor [Ferrimonas lipolytica]